jgi:hypothetical protein
MATPSQQSFAAQYGPYAQQAGSQLGVDPNIILGQWGMETGWQTPASGNLAGISPGGRLASYGSPQAFTNAYVSTIQNNYPNAVGAGSDAGAFNSGLVNGRVGPYYQGNNAASLGQSSPTQLDQTNYYNSLTTAQNSNLMQYSNAGGGSLTSSNAGSGLIEQPTGFTGGDSSTMTTQGGIPTLTVRPQPQPSGSPATGSSSPTALPLDPMSGSSGGAATVGGAASPGYAPGASGGPQAFGLVPGLASGITGWINSVETSVGNAFHGAFAYVLGGLENWFARFGLIIVAGFLILIALWRLMDPDGSKTKEVMTGAMLAA